MSINVRYMDFKSDCRLGNQLYFALSAYKYQKAIGTKVNQSINEELKPLYDTLNIQNYVVGHKTVSWLDLKNTIATGSNMMCQDFGSCYDEELLNEFISDTILKSDIAKQTIPSESVCVQVRGGDYLTAHQGFQFDAAGFLKDAISRVDCSNGIDVFTDDEKYVESKFLNILKEKSENTRIIQQVNPAVDLVKSALYKTKIIWNSTFAYWSAYINNAYFKENHKNIIVPRSFAKECGDGKSFHLNPRWTILEY